MKPLYTLRDLLEALVTLAAMIAVVLQPHPADRARDEIPGKHTVAQVRSHGGYAVMAER